MTFHLKRLPMQPVAFIFLTTNIKITICLRSSPRRHFIFDLFVTTFPGRAFFPRRLNVVAIEVISFMGTRVPAMAACPTAEVPSFGGLIQGYLGPLPECLTPK